MGEGEAVEDGRRKRSRECVWEEQCVVGGREKRRERERERERETTNIKIVYIG